MLRTSLLLGILSFSLTGCCIDQLSGCRCGPGGPCGPFNGGACCDAGCGPWGGGCGSCGGGCECESGCGQCCGLWQGFCGGRFQGGCNNCAPIRSAIGCKSGCGELYVNEWTSDPPDCCDPCDDCGNYAGPRCCPPRPFWNAWRCLWGWRWEGDCCECEQSCGPCRTAHACNTCYDGGHSMPYPSHTPMPTPAPGKPGDPFADDPDGPPKPPKASSPSTRVPTPAAPRSATNAPRRVVSPMQATARAAVSGPALNPPHSVRAGSAVRQASANMR